MPTLHSNHFRPSPPKLFNPKRLLTKALVAAALIGSAGVALSAGSAQANPCADGLCFWSEWTTDTDPDPIGVTYGNFLTFEGSDKRWTYGNRADGVDLFPGLTEISAFEDPGTGKYFVNVDFSPEASQFYTNPFSYSYIAEIFQGNHTFAAVDIDSDTLVSGESLTKEFRKDSFSGDIVQTLESLSGSSEQKPVPDGLTKLYVNVAFTPGQGGVDAYQDSYTQSSRVPGPLPVLGAGMAFGFSRKLRRRIQGQRVTA